MGAARRGQLAMWQAPAETTARIDRMTIDPQRQGEIARGLRRGDRDAWHALYDAYCRRVWLSVSRQMGPAATDVADVVQETFLAAARSARSYDPARGSLWMWLSGIARQHVAQHYRKQKRQDRLRAAAVDGVSDPAAARRLQLQQWLDDGRNAADDVAELLAGTEVAAMVRATLTDLPADYEILLRAKYFDEATVDQIAAEQACSSTAVRSKLARARRAFREAFARASAHAGQRTGGDRHEC